MKKPYLLVFRVLSLVFICGSLFISQVYPFRIAYLAFFCVWSVLILFCMSKPDFPISSEEVDFGPFIIGCLKSFLTAIAFLFGSKLFVEKEAAFVVENIVPLTGSFYYFVLIYCLSISVAYWFWFGSFPKTALPSRPIDFKLAEEKLKNLRTFFFQFKSQKRKIWDILPLTFGFVSFVVYKKGFLLIFFVFCSLLNHLGLFFCFFGSIIILTNLAAYEPFALFMRTTYGENSLKLLGFNNLFSILSTATKNVYPVGVVAIGVSVGALKVISDNDFKDTTRRQEFQDKRVAHLNLSRGPDEQLTPREVSPTNSLGKLGKIFGDKDK